MKSPEVRDRLLKQFSAALEESEEYREVCAKVDAASEARPQWDDEDQNALVAAIAARSAVYMKIRRQFPGIDS